MTFKCELNKEKEDVDNCCKKEKIKKKFPEIELFEDKDNLLKSIKREVKKYGTIINLNYEFGIK